MVKSKVRFLIFIFIAGGLILQTTLSPAQEVLTPAKSYRSLAMGNTGVASANDSAAIFYNPAVLANVEGWWLDYAAWTLEASEGFEAQDVLPIVVSPSLPYINRNGLDDNFRSNFLSKTNPYLRASAGINFTANVMDEGLTIAGSYLMESVITTSDSGANIYQRDDLIKQYGFSIPFFRGKLAIGLVRKDIERRLAIDASTDTTLPNWSDRFVGSTYDAGILYRMANVSRLTWGLAVYNAGGLSFDDASMDAEQTYGFGLSTNHEFGVFRLVTAFDIREIGSTSERQNTIHAGAELGLFPNKTGGSYLTYRVGYNQGYTTQGAEINLFNRSLIVGWTAYGEEIGEGTETLESRRTVLYLSFGF